MTLPASGPISLAQIAAEYSVAANAPFPSSYYGKPGIPASGPLSFADFYGKSNFTLSASKTSITASGFSKVDQSDITSSVSTTFTFTVLSGSASRLTFGASSGTSTFVRVTTPNSGNGAVSCTVRVTASNGDHIDITTEADWGTA